MAVIKIPKPPPSAFNKHRPISALLKNQIVHLQEAEFRLPAREQTNIYINRIRTEGEAAEYIRQVTARLHSEGTLRPGLEIAAVGETATARKDKGKTKPKTKAVVRSEGKNTTKKRVTRVSKKKS